MNFKIKRDFWQVLVGNLFYVLLLCTWIALVAEADLRPLIIFFIITLVCYLFYLVRIIFASCTLKKHALIYQTGIFKYVIFLDEIMSVEKADNLYASLSLSTERVRIATKSKQEGSKVYYISVEGRKELISILTEYAKENNPKKYAKLEQPAVAVAPAPKVEKKVQPASKKEVKKPASKKVANQKASKVEVKVPASPAPQAQVVAPKKAEPAKKVEVKKVPAKKVAPKKEVKVAPKKAEVKVQPKKVAPAKKAEPAKKVEAKKVEAKKAPAKKVAPKKEVKVAPKKAEVKVQPKKVAPAKKAEPAKKVEAKKVEVKKAPAKKTAVKKTSKK